MPISLRLIKDGRVVVQTYTDPLTMSDMEILNETMRDEILAPAAGKVHILADFRSMHSPPIFMLARGAAQLDRSHPNTGVIIGILENSLVYRMGLMFVNLSPKHDIRLTRTFDEAMNMIDDILGDAGQNRPAQEKGNPT
jgi:hypothetical protein